MEHWLHFCLLELKNKLLTSLTPILNLRLLGNIAHGLHQCINILQENLVQFFM